MGKPGLKKEGREYLDHTGATADSIDRLAKEVADEADLAELADIHFAHAIDAQAERACAQAAEELGEKACFPAGTRVAMAGGSWQPIEAIRPGDLVLSRQDDDPNGVWSAETVREVYRRPSRWQIDATLEDESGTSVVLSGTAGHPVWVIGQGWTTLAALEPGMQVVGNGIESLRVVSAKGRLAEQDVFNLNIKGTHTYVVAAGGSTLGIWVHNNCWLVDLVKHHRAALARLYRGAKTVGDEALKKEVLDSLRNLLRSNKWFVDIGRWKPGTDISFFKPGTKLIDGNKSREALKSALVRALGHSFPVRNAAHHLVPVKVAEQFQDFLKKVGFQLDHASNGRFLAADEAMARFINATRHAGNHPGYSKVVGSRVGQIEKQFGTDLDQGMLFEKARALAQERLAKLQSECRELLSADTVAYHPIVIKNNSIGLDSTNKMEAYFNAHLSIYP